MTNKWMLNKEKGNFVFVWLTSSSIIPSRRYLLRWAFQSKVKQTSTGQSRPTWSRAEQQKPEQSCLVQRSLALGPPHSCAIFTAILYHNWAVLHWIKFPSSPHPKLGITVGVTLALATNGWLTCVMPKLNTKCMLYIF